MTKRKSKKDRELTKQKTEDAKEVGNLNVTVRILRKELEEKELAFENDPQRFLEVVIRDEPAIIDLAGGWFVIERRLKQAQITDANKIKRFKENNSRLRGLALDIEKFKIKIRKEGTGSGFRNSKVLNEKAEWILEQAGEFVPVKTIHKELTTKQGFNVQVGLIRDFITEHKAIVDKKKEDYKADLLSGSIVVDSGRLKFWMEAYDYYYERWVMDRKMSDFNVCEKIINNVRTEIKGDVTIKIDGRIDINHSIDSAKNLSQKMGELNISLINIALAAQKNNVNPLLLMSQLTTSYYNKWNGIAEKPLGYEDKNTLVPVSSLIKSYNWDEIREKNSNLPERFETIQEAIVIDEDKLTDNEDKKDKLLRLLREDDEKTEL